MASRGDVLKRPLVFVLLLAWAVAACGSLLGIEQLPLFESDAGDAALEAGDAAPEAACVENLALGCQGCPHAFCDDFDLEDAALGARWISGATPAGGTLSVARTDGGSRGTLVTDHVSPPYGFEAFVTVDSGNGGFIVLANQLAKHTPGPHFAGIYYRFQTRVRKLELPEEQGPLEDSGAALVAGLGPPDFGNAIGVVASPKGLFAVVGGGFFQSFPDASTHRMFDSALSSFGDQPLFIETYVTTRERALAENLERCTNVSSPTVIAIRVNNLIHGCAGLTGPLADISWTLEATFAVGAGTFGRGSATFIHDNVAVDFLE